MTALFPSPHPPIPLSAFSPPPTLASTSDILFFGTVVVAATLVILALWTFDIIRPASFRRSGRRDTGALPWWGWLGAAFATFGAMVLGQMVGVSAAGALGFGPPVPGESTPAQSVLVGVPGYAAAIATGTALIVIIRRARSSGQGADTGLTIRPSDAFHGLGWFVLVVPVVWLVSIATAALAQWYGTETDEIAHVTLRRIADEPADPWIWGVIAIVVVAGPVTEEFIYRVFVQSGLLGLLGRPWLAITLASLFFTAAHWSAVPWYALPGLGAFGFALGLAYERSRRLGVPIVMHALFNLANVGLVLGGQTS